MDRWGRNEGWWACADVPFLSRYYERWCLRRRYVIRGPQYLRKKRVRRFARGFRVNRFDFCRRRGRCYNFRRWTPEPTRWLWRWGHAEGWNPDHPRCMGGEHRVGGRQSERQEALQHRCHGHSSAKEGYDHSVILSGETRLRLGFYSGFRFDPFPLDPFRNVEKKKGGEKEQRFHHSCTYHLILINIPDPSWAWVL